jgi:putative hydrolase of the HAD superfamily
MGVYEAQVKKIKALNIEKYFKKIYILNGFVGERKETAFREIIRMTAHQPSELLCVGNRMSSEIRDGKRCGADTAYFAYGEHVGEKPAFPEDVPDFTVESHKELITKCQL